MIGNSGVLSGAMGIMFVGLKLTGYIDWSWWWVTAPFWAPLIIGGLLAVLWGLFSGVRWWWLV